MEKHHSEEIDWEMFSDSEVERMSNPNKWQLEQPEFLAISKQALDEHVRRRLAKKNKDVSDTPE